MLRQRLTAATRVPSVLLCSGAASLARRRSRFRRAPQRTSSRAPCLGSRAHSAAVRLLFIAAAPVSACACRVAQLARSRCGAWSPAARQQRPRLPQTSLRSQPLAARASPRRRRAASAWWSAQSCRRSALRCAASPQPQAWRTLLRSRGATPTASPPTAGGATRPSQWCAAASRETLRQRLRCALSHVAPPPVSRSAA
jgi:hypothetical protein